MRGYASERELLIQDLLPRAAAEIARRFRSAVDARLKDDAGRDPVTAADLAAERVLLDGIRAAFPEDAILSEESAQDTPADRGRVWVVDPLDGTNNFRQGIPYFCVSVGLWSEGAPVLGAIRTVVDERPETFLAVRGQGATLDGASIRVGAAADPGAAYCSFDSGLTPDERARAARLFDRLAPRLRGVRLLGSAALAQAYVACGRLDAYWNAATLYPWDIAAGRLLVEEAGGRVSRLDGGPVGLAAGDLLASNGGVHDALLAKAAIAVEQGERSTGASV